MRFKLGVFTLYVGFAVFALMSAFMSGVHCAVNGGLAGACLIAASVVQLARAVEDGNRPAEGGSK